MQSESQQQQEQQQQQHHHHQQQHQVPCDNSKPENSAHGLPLFHHQAGAGPSRREPSLSLSLELRGSSPSPQGTRPHPHEAQPLNQNMNAASTGQPALDLENPTVQQQDRRFSAEDSMPSFRPNRRVEAACVASNNNNSNSQEYGQVIDAYIASFNSQSGQDLMMPYIPLSHASSEEVYPPANGIMNNSQMTNCNGYMQGLIPNNVQNVNNQTASTVARDTSEMINQTASTGTHDTSLKRGKETYTGPAICQPMEVNIQNNVSVASTTWQSCDIMKQSLGSNDGQGYMLDSSWNSQSVKWGNHHEQGRGQCSETVKITQQHGQNDMVDAKVVEKRVHKEDTDNVEIVPNTVKNEKQYPLACATHESVVQSKELLLSTLENFLGSLGISFTIPKLEGKELNLHFMYCEVTARGGFEQASSLTVWKEILEAMDISNSSPSTVQKIRKHYADLLFHYEQVYYCRKKGKIQPPVSLPAASSPTMSTVNCKSPGPQEPDNDQSVKKKKRKVDPLQVFGVDPAASVGTLAKGIINGKCDEGYFVTVVLGGQKLTGVLYHATAEDAQQFAKVPSLLTGVGSDSEFPGVEVELYKTRREHSVKKRELGIPRRSKTGYNIYLKEQRAKLLQLNPDSKGLGKKVIEMWNKLPQSEKAIYNERGLQEREKLRKEFQEKLGSVVNNSNTNPNTYEAMNDDGESDDASQGLEDYHVSLDMEDVGTASVQSADGNVYPANGFTVDSGTLHRPPPTVNPYMQQQQQLMQINEHGSETVHYNAEGVETGPVVHANEGRTDDRPEYCVSDGAYTMQQAMFSSNPAQEIVRDADGATVGSEQHQYPGSSKILNMTTCHGLAVNQVSNYPYMQRDYTIDNASQQQYFADRNPSARDWQGVNHMPYSGGDQGYTSVQYQTPMLKPNTNTLSSQSESYSQLPNMQVSYGQRFQTFPQYPGQFVGDVGRTQYGHVVNSHPGQIPNGLGSPSVNKQM